MSNDDPTPTSVGVRRGSRVVPVQSVEESEEQSRIPWFEGSVDTWEPQISAPPPMPAAAPPALRGKERLRDEGEIARGGMGSIRRLYDHELMRHIAMKVLDDELAGNPDMKERFLDEARINGLLDHPNIVPVHELVLDSSGVPSYFTMKLVNGQTLTRLIAAQETRRDLERLLEILIKVCDALALAHSRGIIHRDLKPDNIMVGDFGQVYVMDWGCAHVIGDRSKVVRPPDAEGIVIGTVQYMAPEQAWGKISQIDRRTDVFAIGGILYKMLTGSPPYPGPFAEALPAAQRRQLRSPDESTGVAVKPPPALSRIAMKAMESDPAKRHQSIEELAEELRAFLRGGNWFAMQKFAPGSVIVAEGDPAEAAYIITSGRCEVRKRDPNDPKRTVTLRTLEAGQVFGETAIFADAPRSASVVAIDEVSAVVVERRALDELIRSSFLGQFVKALADRFLDHDAKLTALQKSER